MAQTLGLIDVIWKGRQIPVESGSKLLLGGLQNTGVTTGRRHDYAQSFAPSKITAVTNLFQGQSWSDIYDPSPGELQVQCDTGQSYIFSDAFMTERPEGTGGEGGKLELVWEAGAFEEVIG